MSVGNLLLSLKHISFQSGFRKPPIKITDKPLPVILPDHNAALDKSDQANKTPQKQNFKNMSIKLLILKPLETVKSLKAFTGYTIIKQNEFLFLKI